MFLSGNFFLGFILSNLFLFTKAQQIHAQYLPTEDETMYSKDQESKQKLVFFYFIFFRVKEILDLRI